LFFDGILFFAIFPMAGFVGAEPSSLREYAEPVDQREAARGSLLGMHRRNQQSFSAQASVFLITWLIDKMPNFN
jgi:hypothetical protein